MISAFGVDHVAASISKGLPSALKRINQSDLPSGNVRNYINARKWANADGRQAARYASSGSIDRANKATKSGKNYKAASKRHLTRIQNGTPAATGRRTLSKGMPSSLRNAVKSGDTKRFYEWGVAGKGTKENRAGIEYIHGKLSGKPNKDAAKFISSREGMLLKPHYEYGKTANALRKETIHPNVARESINRYKKRFGGKGLRKPKRTKDSGYYGPQSVKWGPIGKSSQTAYVKAARRAATIKSFPKVNPDPKINFDAKLWGKAIKVRDNNPKSMVHQPAVKEIKRRIRYDVIERSGKRSRDLAAKGNPQRQAKIEQLRDKLTPPRKGPSEAIFENRKVPISYMGNDMFTVHTVRGRTQAHRRNLKIIG